MRTIAAVLVCLFAGSFAAAAQEKPAVDSAKVDAAVTAAFPNVPEDWKSRFVQDETMKECSLHENAPPKAVAAEIQTRERARIEYPADGKFIGDWSAGEKLAQSGYGLRFTDYPPRNPNGGNCYACHQLTKAEVSYGTIGPSLLATARFAISAQPTPKPFTRRSTTRKRRIRARTCRASASTRFLPSIRSRIWWRWS